MPAQRTGGRRVPVHMHNYKAPSPKCERTLCGVHLDQVNFIQDPARVTCQGCRKLLATPRTRALYPGVA